MGIITSIVLSLTLVGISLGALFGFIRGRERALLRLVLVVLSAVFALIFRGAILDAVMKINIGGAPLSDTVTQAFSGGGIPESLQRLILSLVEILVGIISYFIMLFAFRFLTWSIAFPLLKLIIRKVENVRAEKLHAENLAQPAKANEENESFNIESVITEEEATEAPISQIQDISTEAFDTTNEESDELFAQAEEENVENAETENTVFETQTPVDLEIEELLKTDAELQSVSPANQNIVLTNKERKKLIKKHRGVGALVGLAQGVLLAYFLFAPMTGLLNQIAQITSLEINGKPIVELPENLDITGYTESGIGKLYSSTGHWYYSMMSSTTDANGNKISLDETVKLATTLMEVANVATSIENELSILQDENAEPEEVISALNSLGDKLVNVGDSIDELDESTMNTIKDMVVEMSGENASQEEIDEILKNIDAEVFVQAGNGIKAFAEYEQIKLDDGELTEEQASDIVSKAHGCIGLVGDSVTLDVNEEDKTEFKSAIDGMTGISDEDKDALYGLFGIEIPEQ